MNTHKCIWCQSDNSEPLVPLDGSSAFVHPSHFEKARFYTRHNKKALLSYTFWVFGIILGQFLGESVSFGSFLGLAGTVYTYPVATPSSTNFFGIRKTHQIIRTIMVISAIIAIGFYIGGLS